MHIFALKGNVGNRWWGEVCVCNGTALPPVICNCPVVKSIHVLNDSLHPQRKYNLILFTTYPTRFVNLVTSLYQKHEKHAIHRVGETIGIPYWLVELRHEVSHSRLPGLEVLRMAVEFCLQWLRVCYSMMSRISSLSPVFVKGDWMNHISRLYIGKVKLSFWLS